MRVVSRMKVLVRLPDAMQVIPPGRMASLHLHRRCRLTRRPPERWDGDAAARRDRRRPGRAGRQPGRPAAGSRLGGGPDVLGEQVVVAAARQSSQPSLAWQSPDGSQAWARPLADRSTPRWLSNRSAPPLTIPLWWSDLHVAGPQLARDLWRPRDLEEDPDVQADGHHPRRRPPRVRAAAADGGGVTTARPLGGRTPLTDRRQRLERVRWRLDFRPARPHWSV